jgi:glyoxylase-like metal-dependent hydrolase (beta-lactamase superfamily II)
MALSISSRAEQLLCISDVVIHPIHLEEPEWCAAVDVLPGQVLNTRHKILDRASAEKSLVMPFHFPFPALGYIFKQGEKWGWQAKSS